jgi:tellurite resistance protein TerC
VVSLGVTLAILAAGIIGSLGATRAKPSQVTAAE